MDDYFENLVTGEDKDKKYFVVVPYRQTRDLVILVLYLKYMKTLAPTARKLD